jgi:hypothetical protein
VIAQSCWKYPNVDGGEATRSSIESISTDFSRAVRPPAMTGTIAFARRRSWYRAGVIISQVTWGLGGHEGHPAEVAARIRRSTTEG